MSAIQITSSDKKQVKRTTTAFDQSMAFSQGYFLRITSATVPNIASVVSAAGVITLPQVYPVGRSALRVYVDGLLLPQPGVDYTEDSSLQITLAAGHVAVLNSSTSVIFIEWNRFLPGVRDQSFEDLTDIIPDVSAAVRDTGGNRTSPATGSNSLPTFADLGDLSNLTVSGGLGFAGGFWDFRGRVDFSAGTVSTFPDGATRTALPAPSSSYSGDTLSSVLGAVFYMLHTNRSGTSGGTNDQSYLVIGAFGSSSVDNGGPPTTGDQGTFWGGSPLAGLVYEGGVLSSPTTDIDLGFGVITGSNGTQYFLGRVGFLAIGVKA